MDIKTVPIDSIKPYEKNAKKHPDEQVEQIANSLKEFGWQQPLVIDKDNIVVIGHGRLLAAKRLGMKEVPVVCADGLTDEQIKALRLADNQLSISPFDYDLLSDELDNIFDIDMSLFGFDDAIRADDFGDDFTLPDGDKPEIVQMTFTLHERQKELIEDALSRVEVSETFGNTNKNGNAIYEACRQWEEQRR